MHIWLRGTAAKVALLVMAVVGFVLAMGDVLDIYDAQWKFTVPATLVIGVLIWRFALSPAKGEPAPEAVWPLGLDVILAKLVMTTAILLGILGVIALVYDVYGLIAGNWPMILLALVLLAVILGWAMLAGRKEDKRGGDAPSSKGDDLVS